MTRTKPKEGEVWLEVDEEDCIRCGTELISDEDFKTGICPDCWTDEDNEQGETL